MRSCLAELGDNSEQALGLHWCPPRFYFSLRNDLFPLALPFFPPSLFFHLPHPWVVSSPQESWQRHQGTGFEKGESVRIVMGLSLQRAEQLLVDINLFIVKAH